VQAILKGALKALLTRYTYTKVTIKIIKTREDYKVYINIEYSQPLINKKWLRKHPIAIINKFKSMVIKGLRARIKLKGLATFNIYIPRVINSRKALGKV
jgi:hypothetical protein